MQRLAEKYNIPQEIVNIWCKEEGKDLLPLQIAVIEDFQLLEGNSLLITAPTSSGKTFVGELAAINSYYMGKKTIFLVPMKAIAEEKYLEFMNKYHNFGLRIVISTHDRIEFDDLILAGYFDIAIIIFEKMNVLLTQSPAILNSCGLVVIDELQLLNDKSRGPALEILLTKIKMIKNQIPEQFQFLGLSAVLADLNYFDKWLNATYYENLSRPLELHEGVLFTDGTFKIRNFNDHKEYCEKIPGISKIHIPLGPPQNRREAELLENSILQRLFCLCKYFLDMGKHILIFRKWRPLTRNTALKLAEKLSLSPASNVIQALGEIENTNSREILLQCLGGGIAFHNSDLSPEERMAIESDFRNPQGQIKVVCSTSTLAMGVNLPSSVVIIPDTLKPDPDAEDFHEIPISTAEYKNMSGRAGRTCFKEEGISILLSNSDAEATRYWHQYIKGKLDTILPPLKDKDLRKIMLSLFASGLCKDQTGIHTFLLSTYTGFLHWNKNSGTRDAFLKVIIENCSFLKRYKLLDEGENGSLYTSRIGTLCAISGVEVESFVLLQKTLENIDPTDWDHWEIIFPCLHCQELADLIRIYIRVSNPRETYRLLENLNPKNYEILLDWSKSILRSSNDVVKRVQVFLILNDWIYGLEMRKIENKYTIGNNDRILSGTIRSIAETSAWMIQTLYKIAYVLNYDIDFIEAIQILSERVDRGVKAEGIDLHKLKVRGVTRTTINKLIDAGYISLDHILDTPANNFRGIINPVIAQRIHEAIVQEFEESQERAKYLQASRLERYGFDPQIIRNIYEKEGIALEDAIVDLLNAPTFELGAERIKNQAHGEPDIRLYLKEGLLVGSVTASKTNISDKKCAEILSSGARMNPTAYAVFGRPNFHELAIQNSLHLNKQLDTSKSYKLIPIQELGELFVRIVEGTLKKDKFIEILMNQRGIIKSKMFQ